MKTPILILAISLVAGTITVFGQKQVQYDGYTFILNDRISVPKKYK